MRQFYLTFNNSYALRSELSWTHYRLLMRLENEEKRDFYIDECIKSNWSTRQLERQIKLDLKYGLPFCTVNLFYNGKFMCIDNVLLDTGSGGTVFKMDVVEEIGRYDKSKEGAEKC